MLSFASQLDLPSKIALTTLTRSSSYSKCTPTQMQLLACQVKVRFSQPLMHILTEV